MSNLAQKCIQLKPQSNTHRLAGLMVGILEENTEVFIRLLLSVPLHVFKNFGPATAYFSQLFCYLIQFFLLNFKHEWAFCNVSGCFGRVFQRIWPLVRCLHLI